jgi:hypothetical protein
MLIVTSETYGDFCGRFWKVSVVLACRYALRISRQDSVFTLMFGTAMARSLELVEFSRLGQEAKLQWAGPGHHSELSSWAVVEFKYVRLR